MRTARERGIGSRLSGRGDRASCRAARRPPCSPRRAVIALDPKPEQLNHNGTVNAAILFGLAEVAGAGAVVAGVLELAASSYTVVRRGTIDYLGPARGQVVATGTVQGSDPALIRAALESDGSIEVDAHVEVTDASDRSVASSTMTVVLRPRRSEGRVLRPRYVGRMLEPGDKAPAINLLNQDGEKVKLSDFKGRKVLVYFYPKADTPGCTTQSCGLRDILGEVGDTAIVGISPDEPAKQKRFDEKYGLGFPLLADTEHKVAEAYGVWAEKSMYGRKYMGIVRSAFLVDAQGKIANAWYKVSPKDTPTNLLGALAA